MRHRVKFPLWVISLALLAGVVIMILLTHDPEAHADMCGPQPGLPGGSYPWIQSCNIWVPFLPGVSVPMPGPGGNAMYPVPGLGGAGGWGPSSYPWGSYNPLPYTPPSP